MRSDIFNIDVYITLRRFEIGISNPVWFLHRISNSKTIDFTEYPQALLASISQNDILRPDLEFSKTLLSTIILEELKIFKKLGRKL